MTPREREELRSYVSGVLRDAEGENLSLKDSDSLVLSGRISSLDVIGLISFLESRFGYVVDPNYFDQAQFDSIDSMAKLLDEQRGSRPNESGR